MWEAVRDIPQKDLLQKEQQELILSSITLNDRNTHYKFPIF